MPVQKLDGLFNKLDLPVIACTLDGDELKVAFLNAVAKMFFAPGGSRTRVWELGRSMRLGEVLRFKSDGAFRVFHNTLRDFGAVHRLDTEVLSFRDEVVPARLYASAGSLDGRDFFFIYVATRPEHFAGDTLEAFMSAMLNASYRADSADEAIQTVLGIAGDFVKASRAYIFECPEADAICLTYEWCSPGVDSIVQKDGAIVRTGHTRLLTAGTSGMVVTDDTSRLPDDERRELEKQGIKAVVSIPLLHFDKTLGYIEFDDCFNNRRWSLEEIQALKNAAGILITLVNRRNAEREAQRGREVAQTITDNLDDLVYISDLETYELKFATKSLARAVGCEIEDVIGLPCWKVLHRDQDGPCPFCPIPRLRERLAAGEEGSYVWELHNNVTGKWYMVKDSIVDWTDGEKAHLGTLVDITYRKQYEEQLKRFAATDAMTDVYNRKWGYGKLDDLFQADKAVRESLTMCFIDLDGLKAVNDRLGHAAGDDMIVNAVRTIFSCIRKEDFICRWGGDEFILVLHCAMDDAAKVMDKIMFGVTHFNTTRNKPYILSLSYGLVPFSAPFETLEDLIDEADRRMYEHKMGKRKADL